MLKVEVFANNVLRRELLERDNIICGESIRQVRRRNCRDAVEEVGVCIEAPSCQPKDEMLRIRAQYSTGLDIVSKSKYHAGTYVDLWIGLELWCPWTVRRRPGYGSVRR